MIRSGTLAGILATAALLAAGGAPGSSSNAVAANPLGPPLRLKSTWPKDRSVDVLTDPVVLRLSRPVDFATVNSSTFQVYAGGGLGLVAGTYAPGQGKKGPDPRTIVFTPDVPIPAQSLCLVKVWEGLLSDRGRPLDERVEFTFATSAAKDEGAVVPLGPKDRPKKLPSRGPLPKVTYTFPDAGYGNFLSDEIRIRFNRPMDSETIRTSNILVLDGGYPVPGTIGFPEDQESRELRFTPEFALYPDNNYEILVTRSVRTAKGRFLRSEFRAGFATSPLKKGVRPLHPEGFVPGPLLEHGRAFHTANAIAGGDVVLAGGQTYDGAPLASVEIFRRGTESVFRAADMAVARRKHASVTLADGRVLVCGGFGPTGTTVTSTEIYNPVSNTWVGVASMAASRANHTATLLANGRVLVAAGYTTDTGPLTYTRTAEIFNPSTNTWSAAGAPVVDRGGHTATMLHDGRVLLAGGNRFGENVSELFLPQTGSFRATLGQALESRIFHAAVVTQAGTVLLAGGFPGQAEQFTPSTESFTTAGHCPNPGTGISESTIFPTLTLLPGIGGRVAYIGGLLDAIDLVSASTQVWNPKGSGNTGSFTAMLFAMDVPRAAHTVTTLGDGRFLIAGGFGTEGDENERRLTILSPDL